MTQLLTLIGRNLTTLVLWAALIFLACFLLAALVTVVRTLWRRWQRHEAAQQAARDRAWLQRELAATHARSLRYRGGAGHQTPDGPAGPGPRRAA